MLLPNKILQALCQCCLKIAGVELVHVDRLHLNLLRPRIGNHLAVLLLLRGCQGLNPHFQLHGLYHVFALAEPQDQIVTFLHALGEHPLLIIQSSQLIGPLLLIFTALVFLQDGNLIFHRRTPALINLIFQHIASQIVGSNLRKFLVQLNRFLKVPKLYGHLRHTIDNHASDGRTVIGHIQDLIAVLISLQVLINITDTHQKPHIAYFSPVYGIRNLSRRFVFLLLKQLLHLFCFYLKFIFIQ